MASRHSGIPPCLRYGKAGKVSGGYRLRRRPSGPFIGFPLFLRTSAYIEKEQQAHQ